ncbi:phage major capsid protein [Salipiger bermudensis]|uniref:phage major capsid protein n=1 Tax=Salipiger bermudensis TaxID=344736 RepID=UPI001F5DC1E4|nr:phage major capsid protein [Salipiger bermudensis]
MSKHMNPAKARGIVAVRADAGGVADIIANLQRDWKAWKDTQAEKDQEISAKFDDVVTTEKFQRIDASVSDLQAAVDQANAQLAAIAMQGGGPGQVADAEYTEAFRAHFTKGAVQAALNKGADDEGGFLAPTEWDRTITDALVEVSPMRQISSVQRISKNAFTKLFNLRGTGSGWVGEAAARPETNTPTFGDMTITPGEIYANPGATQGMLDDAEVDLEQWIAGEVETEFAKQEGLAFVSGNGTNKPAGFLSFATGGANAATNPLGAIEVLPAAATGAVTEDELLDLIYAVPSAYTAEARFTMNRTSMGLVRKLRDSDGRQLWQPSSQAGQPSQLLAYPLTELPDMPDMAASAMSIAFGNFRRGYLIVDRAGVRVLRDPFTAKPKVLFYTTKRVGGAVVDPQGLKVLQHAAS